MLIRHAVVCQTHFQESIVQNVKTFFESVKLELSKVTWPTRKETVATTGVVIMIVFMVSIYLGLCDVVLSKLMRLVLG
ncbi:preprotein translocase subunit SecE [Trichlorobacter lovleyi]|uniref:preprotein translocase subunit SecE n=1 Tax=Trichlorobacter lovleyi TaxID=313985 RepID=UPI0002DF9E9C